MALWTECLRALGMALTQAGAWAVAAAQRGVVDSCQQDQGLAYLTTQRVMQERCVVGVHGY